MTVGSVIEKILIKERNYITCILYQIPVVVYWYWVAN